VICVKFEQCKRGILSNVVFCGCVTMSKNFIARTKPRDDDDDIESSSVRACVSLFYKFCYVLCGTCGKSSWPFSVCCFVHIYHKFTRTKETRCRRDWDICVVVVNYY
jgi:hypothetical protein